MATRVPERSYTDTIDYATGADVPEKPMTCADCGAPTFYEDEGEPGGYYHAVLNPLPGCWAYNSWMMGDVDDPNHPLYDEWQRTHDESGNPIS